MFLVTFKKLHSGVASFARHLAKQMPEATLIRVGHNRRQDPESAFLGIAMQDDLDGPIILLDTPKSGEAEKYLPWIRRHKCVLVVHDPRSLTGDKANVLPHVKEVVIIRKKNLRMVRQHLPNTPITFIPHPYTRELTDESALSNDFRNHHAVSHARVDFDKFTHVIVQANKLLPPEFRVKIHGRENRAYVEWTIKKHDPTWVHGQAAYPDDASPVTICRLGHFDVDLTQIQGDGGGTQYCFLEAADAGTVPIMRDDWGMGSVHCIEISSSDLVNHLVAILRTTPSRPMHIVEANLERLKQHQNVGRQYADILARCR